MSPGRFVGLPRWRRGVRLRLRESIIVVLSIKRFGTIRIDSEIEIEVVERSRLV